MATRSTKTTPKSSKTGPKTATNKTKTAVAPLKTANVTTATAVAASLAAATTASKGEGAEVMNTVVAQAPLKKPELIERVVAETGMKKKDVKPVVEAMLAVLGRALVGGEDLTVPPLGKLMIKRTKEAPNATIVTLKLRQPNAMGAGGQGGGKTSNEDDVI